MIDLDFDECRAISVPPAERNIESLLMSSITGAVSIRQASLLEDKSGTDYFVELRRGGVVNIDLKIRRKGCARFWKTGPELALEKWSVIPNEENKGITGWTLSEKSSTHYTLHIFDPVDTEMIYMLPFQLLRMAFRQNGARWESQYGRQIQHSTRCGRRWKSESVFVPASAVIEAITERMSWR